MTDDREGRIIAAHDYLYSDRHKRLYTDIRVYLRDYHNAARFVQLLEQGKTTPEICEALKLQYRADVWFASLILHFLMREGYFSTLSLTVEIPEELRPRLAELDSAWRNRPRHPRPTED